MALNFRFKIKNLKLAMLACLFICIFAGLGTWQLSRGYEKRYMLSAFAERTIQAPLHVEALNNNAKDLRFYRITLTGNFDNQHNLLLDNKIYHGRVGYELYTPFIANGFDQPILVDRGFIPLGQNRSILPGINAVIGNVDIVGMLNVPPRYVTLGNMTESAEPQWPLRIQFIHLQQLGNLLDAALFPYIVSLEPHHPAAYAMEWQIVAMPPERHFGYAVQWFALALTLLILSVILNFERSR